MYSNAKLRVAFQQLNETAVQTIDANSAADFLFESSVLAASDCRKLSEIPSETDRSRHLLALLHTRSHPFAFVKMREVLSKEIAHAWFVEAVDDRCAKNDSLPPADEPENDSPGSHVLSEDGKEITGLAILGDKLFVVRRPTEQMIHIYDTVTLSLKPKHLDVPGLGDLSFGFASCEKDTCLYVSSFLFATVYRVKLDATSRGGNKSDVTKWRTHLVGFTTGLSVKSDGHVLAVCWCRPDMVREFTTDGCLVRSVSIPGDILSPEHAIGLSNHQFVISHGNHQHRTLHRVCILDKNGAYLHIHGHHPGMSLCSPRRLAVSKNGFILVADMDNDRVVVLDSSLTSMQVVPQSMAGHGFNKPYALCLEESRDRLYVGEESGRLIVINHFSNGIQL